MQYLTTAALLAATVAAKNTPEGWRQVMYAPSENVTITDYNLRVKNGTVLSVNFTMKTNPPDAYNVKWYGIDPDNRPASVECSITNPQMTGPDSIFQSETTQKCGNSNYTFAMREFYPITPLQKTFLDHWDLIVHDESFNQGG
jgi:hypothetical protein